MFQEELVGVFGTPSGTNRVFVLAVAGPTFMSLLVARFVSGRTGFYDVIAVLDWMMPT
jgi:hypothetical protein